jgi:hypothetical protein
MASKQKLILEFENGHLRKWTVKGWPPPGEPDALKDIRSRLSKLEADWGSAMCLLSMAIPRIIRQNEHHKDLDDFDCHMLFLKNSGAVEQALAQLLRTQKDENGLPIAPNGSIVN